MSSRWGVWRETLATGALFVAVFFAVQWPFADFLQSPGARNWFFGTHYFGYYEHPTWLQPPVSLLHRRARSRTSATVMALAVVLAMLGSALGLRLARLDAEGQAMKRALAFVAVAIAAAVAWPATASAHVGSPDVYFEGAAGPYRVLVTVRPPDAVPGIAEVTARVADAAIDRHDDGAAAGAGHRRAPVAHARRGGARPRRRAAPSSGTCG